ncbi:MAG TPA: CsiV family protein [Spongiibacteraceae bacterium]|nr:CsiV family protein [Spongiibacteraceae bacterium]
MKKIVCGLLLAMGSLLSNAHADTNYQVEIIVFARDAADSEESLRSSSDLRYPSKTVTLSAGEGSAPFQLMPPNNLLLNREAGALEQHRGTRVLLHQAWLWPGEDAAHATAVAISAGRQFGIHREVEGYITLSAERFLQINTQLWLSRFGSGAANPANTLALPTPPATNSGAANTDQRAAAADNYTIEQLFLLREQRRMRSGELHYFDHSRFGLLVLVTPLAAAP